MADRPVVMWGCGDEPESYIPGTPESRARAERLMAETAALFARPKK